MAAYDITALDSPVEIAASGAITTSICTLKTTRVAVAWSEQTTTDGFVQCFSVNETTGAMAAEGTALEFDTTSASNISILAIDSTHFLIFWTQSASQSYVRMFSVNDGTGAITAMGASPTSISTNSLTQFDSVLLDSTHVAFAYGNASDEDIEMASASVNTSTGAITIISTADIKTTFYTNTLSLGKISSSKVIAFYNDSSSTNDGFAIVMDINNSTWAVTAAGAELEYDTASGKLNNCVVMTTGSPTYVVNAYYDTARKVQSFSVNTSTWAIASFGGETTVSVTIDENPPSVRSLLKVDDTHFISFLGGTGADGYAISWGYDTGTGAMTELDVLEFDTSSGVGNSSCICGNFFVNAWCGTTNYRVQAFDIEDPVSGPANLKTYNTNAKANIKTINTNPIANVKTLNTNA